MEYINIENLSENITNNMDDTEIWDLLNNVVSSPNLVNEKSVIIQKEKINDNKCISCNSEEVIYDPRKGYNVCNFCGVINNELLERSVDFGYSNRENKTTNYGAPTSYFFPDSSTGTSVGNYKNNRISRQNSWGGQYKERSKREVFNLIENNCKKANITKAIVYNAQIMYNNISKIKHKQGKNKGHFIILRGLNRKRIIAACLFFGAKKQGETRSPKEIADIFALSVKQVTKGINKFQSLMDENISIYELSTSKSTDFIKRFSDKLNIDEEYIKLTIRIANNVDKLNLASSHQPPSIAAACIFLMIKITELNITKKIISNIVKTSEVTITKAFNKIAPYKNVLVSDSKTELVLKRIKEIDDNDSLKS